jgi:hypothetical protein
VFVLNLVVVIKRLLPLPVSDQQSFDAAVIAFRVSLCMQFGRIVHESCFSAL